MQMLISVILKRSLNYLAEKGKRIDWRINEFSSIASQMDWKVVCCFSCKTTWHILSVCVVWLWTLLHSTLLGSRHGRKINCLNESRADGINSSSSSSSSCAYPSPTYTNLLKSNAIIYIHKSIYYLIYKLNTEVYKATNIYVRYWYKKKKKNKKKPQLFAQLCTYWNCLLLLLLPI